MRSSKLPFLSTPATSDSSRGDYSRIGSAGSPRYRKFRWKYFVFSACILLSLVVLLGPRHRREKVLSSWSGNGEVQHSDATTIPDNPVSFTTTTTATPPTTSTAPHSFEEDPNPLKTTRCNAPLDRSKPLVQYGLMIDAGSTGSRIHVYKFNNCKTQPEYEYEVFLQKRPGLSSFAESPLAAAASLDELLDRAMATVPESLRSCTPVSVKATAGLRLLGSDASARILQEVRNRILSHYPFPLLDEDSVAIMDGKDEGVYAWITTNYLLGALNNEAFDSRNTYAVLDLGGASTQIVFEPSLGHGISTPLADGEHNYELKFAGQSYSLYQHSYLGYGLMAARQSVHLLANFTSTFHKALDSNDNSTPVVPNPCLSRTMSKLISFGEGQDALEVNMTGADVGSYMGCRRLIELVLAKDAICQVKPCSFNGVYQPSIMDAFPTGNIMLLSYFYDRLSPLIRATDSSLQLPVGDIAVLAQQVCDGPESWKEHFGSNEFAAEELSDRPEYCLDLTFMYTLLRLGYEFDDQRMVTLGKQVAGTELGWALGAGIGLIGAEITCKA